MTVLGRWREQISCEQVELTRVARSSPRLATRAKPSIASRNSPRIFVRVIEESFDALTLTRVVWEVMRKRQDLPPIQVGVGLIG